MSKADKDRLPDILCIGAQKAGTSWFHQIFGSRNDVWTPLFKEQHFFDFLFIERHQGWIGPHVQRGYAAVRDRFEDQEHDWAKQQLNDLEKIEAKEHGTLDWYKAIFAAAPADKLAMDVTPEYSCIPQEGLNYIKKLMPQIKLIYLIRDPVERMKSQVRMNISRIKSEDPTKEISWRWEGRSPAVRHRGNYAEYLPRWDKTFGRDQLLFLPFGMIRDDPERLLATVERFLGIDPGTYEGADRQVHWTTKRDLPDETLEQIEIGAEPQYAFLKQFFDQDFLDMIR